MRPATGADNLKVYVCSCGHERLPVWEIDASADEPHELTRIPYGFYLVSHPDGELLFDVGLSPDVIERASNGRYDDAQLDVSADDTALAILQRLGVDPGRIRYVVLSHLHFDHAGGAKLFPDAEVFVQEAEWKFALAPPPHQAGAYRRDEFEGLRSLRLLDAAFDVFGDGRVVAFPTPGHTPGHQSLFVQLEHHASLVLLADAAYDLGCMRRGRLPGFLWDADTTAATWQRLLRMETDAAAVLIATHDRTQEQEIRQLPNYYA